ncbi:MAG: hypothetical protein A3K83_01685, partial [Omnitrophica WOR_2 bacterium RBG_13_44_8b]
MNNRITLLLLLLLLVSSLFIRLPFLSVPLERDEGVRAVIAEGMLEGGLPYRDFYTNKPPLIFFIYAFIFKTLGRTVEDIHFFMHLYTLISICALFILARAVSKDNLTSLVSAFFLSITTISPKVYGNAANLEIFMILPVMLSAIFAYKAVGKRALSFLFLSGFFAGIAFWIKQSGIFDLFFILTFVSYETLIGKDISKPLYLKAISVVLAGFAAISLVMLYYFWSNNIFDDAILWIFQVGIPYVSRWHFSWRRFSVVTKPIFAENIMMYMLAVIALLNLRRKGTRIAVFLSLWSIFLVLAVLPGFRFIQHYYIQVFPPVALLAGFGAAEVAAKIRRFRLRPLRVLSRVIVISLIAYFPLEANYDFIFRYSPFHISKKTYCTTYNPFVESLEIAEYIRRNTSESDPILVVGNEPQIYFYAKRKSATGHIGFFYIFQDFPLDSPLQRKAYDEIIERR